MYTYKIYGGGYYSRQMAANKDGAICYFEQHFNSTTSSAANYSSVVVANNASQKSMDWAATYLSILSDSLGINPPKGGGILVGGYQGRGNFNLKFTDMPAILGEPLFVSNVEQSEIVKSPEGRQQLAQVLVNSIVTCFPDGGLVGFSVGHKYKDDKPNDRGAPVTGNDPDPNDGLENVEADYAEDVLKRACLLLDEIQ
jgi:hypothetical protein